MDIDYQTSNEDDFPPFWIESHFSRPVRLMLRNTATQSHPYGITNDKSLINDKPLPNVSLADVSMTPTGSNNNNHHGFPSTTTSQDMQQNDYDDDDDEKGKGGKKKKKKKGKSKKRDKKKRREGKADIQPQVQTFWNDMPSTTPQYQNTGTCIYIYTYIYLFNHSLIQSSIHSSIHSFIYLFIH